MNKIKERYDDITKKFLDKGCKIITTYDEFSKLEGTYKKISIIASCSHRIDNVYIHTFINRDSGNRCKECTKKDTKKILIPTKKNCPDCNIIILYKSTRCNECTVKNTITTNIKKTNRPSLEELEEDFKNLKSYVNVGKKYNVSDNAIRKWIKSYNKIQ